MSRTGHLSLLLLALLFVVGVFAAQADAEEGGGATWRLEQPLPPELPTGQKSTVEIPLGRIGDIEFWAPNRGLLITAGNPPAIPPGLWFYNGRGWHQLTGEGPQHEGICGATDGRIAWAGPDEFWTISDGRKGQASTEEQPPLEDNTLCRFAGGQVAGSFGSLAFLPTSYQAMHGAGCLGPEDCWFAGGLLPQSKTGAFQLHWNGHALAEEPAEQGEAIDDMRAFGGSLYESVRVNSEALLPGESPSEPSDLHVIEPAGVQPPFVSLFPGVPTYAPGEFPEALDFLRLSADEQALWGAADPVSSPPKGSAAGQVTIVRDAYGAWSQPVGPSTPERENPFAKEGATVSAMAAEPPDEGERAEGSESAWLALTSTANSNKGAHAPAIVARLSASGTLSERQELPTPEEVEKGEGPKGAADKIACPAPHDCWLATTQGWLFHLAPESERQLPEDTDPNFSHLITFRPQDAGVPAVVPDAPPEDDSGLPGEVPTVGGSFTETASVKQEGKVALPLLSNIHTRLVHGSTLELRFHLAVKAKLRLIAKRHKSVVASTPTRTLAAGNRKLELRLNPRRWPTKLTLQSHPLAPLPTASTKAANPNTNTISTGLTALPTTRTFASLGPLG